jgi:lipid A ethanolaminephosphotransferase
MSVASVLVIVGVMLAIFKIHSSIMRNHTQLRYLVNPLNSYYAIGMVAAKPFQMDEKNAATHWPRRSVGGPQALPKSLPFCCWYSGETARMGNFGVNGYKDGRPTPELAKENIISLKGVMSCGTSTATSVPCLFSHFGKEDFVDRKVDVRKSD